MAEEDRKVCTPERPWSEGEGAAIHPDARFLYAEDAGLAEGGSYDRYECPNCHLRFWVTVPD